MRTHATEEVNEIQDNQTTPFVDEDVWDGDEGAYDKEIDEIIYGPPDDLWEFCYGEEFKPNVN